MSTYERTRRASQSPARVRVVGDEPAVERGRDRVADRDEHAVAGTEGEVPEHRFGFVREQELQRVVPAQLARAGDDDGDDGVGERRLGATGVDHVRSATRSSSAATAARRIAGLPSK